MARIMMKKAHNESISEAFEGFMLSAQSRGLTDKTLIVLTAAQTLLIMFRYKCSIQKNLGTEKFQGFFKKNQYLYFLQSSISCFLEETPNFR